MRVSVRVTVCVVVVLVGTAQPAHAIWRWLEHMSGPGWYDGFSIEKKLWCKYPTDLPASTTEALAIVKRTTSPQTLAAFEQSEMRGLNRSSVLSAIRKHSRFMSSAAISFPCRSDRRVGDISRHRKQTTGWSAGLLWSTINRLQYADSVQPQDTQVWVLTAGPFYDHRLSGLLNHVEVGASAEGYLFFGSTTKTMFRVALEPRATVTLGTIRDEASGNPAINLKVRVGALWVVPGFNPEDFGALPGERLGPEVLTSIRLVIDMECLPWKRGSC